MKTEVVLIIFLLVAGVVTVVLYKLQTAKESYLYNNNQYPALYINLDHRLDRRNQIEYEFDKMDINTYNRIDAIKNIKGYIGCSQSHIACLTYAKKMGYPRMIIFEDDFQFLIDSQEFHRLLDHLLSVNYDVMMLSYNSPSNDITDIGDPLLRRIRDTQTSSGYIVSQHYYDTLLNNLKEGLEKLLETDNVSVYAIDIYWKQLQKKDKWLCYYKRMGKQRESYSDIENKVTNNTHLK